MFSFKFRFFYKKDQFSEFAWLLIEDFMKPLKNLSLEIKLPKIYIRFWGFSKSPPFDVRKVKVIV